MNIYISFIIMLLIGIIISLLGDIIVIKKRLKKYPTVIADIIYFEEVQLFRGGSCIAVVKYMKDNVEKSAIIHKAKKDKIGDKVEIVTDGKLAARNSIVLKQDLSIGGIIGSVIVMVLFGQYIDNLYASLAFNCMVVIEFFLMITYPYVYEAHYCEMKDRLGWHD